MRILIDLNLDGFEDKKAHDKACVEYLEEMLDSSGSSVKILAKGEDALTKAESDAHLKFELSYYTPIQY